MVSSMTVLSAEKVSDGNGGGNTVISDGGGRYGDRLNFCVGGLGND